MEMSDTLSVTPISAPAGTSGGVGLPTGGADWSTWLQNSLGTALSYAGQYKLIQAMAGAGVPASAGGAMFNEGQPSGGGLSLGKIAPWLIGGAVLLIVVRAMR